MTELSAKTHRGVALSPTERAELESITATSAPELSRMRGLLQGCSEHSEATVEARAFVQGLEARLAQGHARLEELAPRHGEGGIGRDAPAPKPLEAFVAAAARSRRADAHVVLSGDGTGAAVRSGRFARWRGERQTAGNQAVAERFLAALRSTYGDQVAEIAGKHRWRATGAEVGSRASGATRQRDGLPGERLAVQYREANERLVEMYVKPRESTGHSLTGIKIDDEARRIERGFGPKGVTALVDPSLVADKVSEAIRAKGGGGRRLVTTDDARQILDTVVRRELLAAYEAARADAMHKLSLDDPASLASRSLAGAVAAQGVALDPQRLQPGAVNTLTRRIDEAVRSLDAASLGRDAALQGIADEVASDFVAERAQAHAAVLASDLEGTARERIADQVVHDGTPAALVTHMAAACIAGRPTSGAGRSDGRHGNGDRTRQPP